MTRVQPLHIKNALIWDETGGDQRDLYTAEIVRAVPVPDAITVDLDGYFVFPGLVNAHDHLELNHYPRLRFRDRYANAHQWGEDVNLRLDEPPLRDLRAVPLADQLLIGGLKNLLCGATTVIHHNALHKPLRRSDFPVRVLQKYGWSHSLRFDTEAEIVESYQNTPPNVSWFIHLAEGTDEIAAEEYQRLKALGCVGANTVIIHGVGLSDNDIADAAPRVRGLVWCPSTNLYLLGATANIDGWIAAGGRVAVGSDSRLTADGDLLNEIVIATRLSPQWGTHLAMLTDEQPNMLRPGSLADWFALPALTNTAATSRANLALVVKGGVPQIGNPDVMARFPHIETVPAVLDGAPKAINVTLARQITRCSLQEPGLMLEADAVGMTRESLSQRASMPEWIKRIF